MTKRLADLALLTAVLVISVVAIAPNRQPVGQTAGQGGSETTSDAGADKPDRLGGGEADHPRRTPPDAGRTRDRYWPEGFSDRSLPRLPRNREVEELTPELIDACIGVAEDIDPQLAQRLISQREEDPAKLERLLHQRGRRLLDLALLKDNDPNLYDLKLVELKLDSQISETAAQLRAAYAAEDAAQIDVLESNLRLHLRLQLAFALRAREDYICRLQEHVERLQEQWEYDHAHIDELVELKFHQLIESSPPVTGSSRGIHREPPGGTGAVREFVR
ncbi:MAG: hypothetical protein JSV91_02370 [Phycisphaerales bacterium]|nr:MAG: hypothetical protein JSV91_02370 [Phycisphaerales bacterium]